MATRNNSQVSVAAPHNSSTRQRRPYRKPVVASTRMFVEMQACTSNAGCPNVAGCRCDKKRGVCVGIGPGGSC
jgi:hypothetical protein